MKYIVNATGITFFHQGKPIKIDKNTARYAKIVRAFDLPESEQEDKIFAILEEQSEEFSKDGFEIRGNAVSYLGEELPEVLAQKIISIINDGLPVKLFAKFWENLQENPSSSSVRELYEFLAYKELPITEDGCFLAYKGVSNDFWSISGNTKTKVIKGQVDKSGRILNTVGSEIEVKRWDVDDNRENHCSFGLHVGSLDYARDFGQTVLVVKVNPKDVVSVPNDCHCQKCRVSAYKVIDIFEQPIEASVTNENGEEIESEEEIERREFVERVDRYISKKYMGGFEKVNIKSIQNSFSPDYPSRVRIIDAINELGYTWEYDEHGVPTVVFE